MLTLLELKQRQRRRFSNFNKRIEKNETTYIKPQPMNKPHSQIVRQMQRDVLARQKENRNRKALQEIKRKENSKQMKKQNILKNREMYNWLQEYKEQTKKERKENMEKERRRTIIYDDDWSQEEIIEKAREELQRRMETQDRQPVIINENDVNRYLNLELTGSSFLKECKKAKLNFYEVSKEVNKPTNNNISLIQTIS